MSLPTPYTVQRLPWTPGEKDSHGNLTDTWGDPVDVKVHGWAPPGAENENDVGRTQVIRDLDVYAPTGTTADPHDRMIVDGDLYEVVGHPEDYSHGPFGYRAGVRINLNRVEG